MKYLTFILSFILFFMAPAAIAQAGIFSLPNESTLTSPVTNQTIVFDQTQTQWLYYNGSGFVPAAPPIGNTSASVAPTSSNDNTQGYRVGSLWIDTTHSTSYICISAATSAAVWNALTSSVAVTVPSWMSLSGSPVTTNGTFALGTNSTNANWFLGSPNGSAGSLTPRAIVTADLPLIPLSGGGTGSALSAVSGAILYSNGTSLALNSAGTSGQPLLSAGTATPTFGTVGLTYGGTGANLSSASNGALPYINNSGVMTTMAAGSAPNVIPAWNGSAWNPLTYSDAAEKCRITLTSGTPVTTGNVSGASTFYVDPYMGSIVWLPDTTGNNLAPYAFSEISTAVPSAKFRLYDVFLYNNSGTVTVATTAWDSGGQTTGTITGATAANPCVLTSTNSLTAGQYIGIAGITGTLGTSSTLGLNGHVFKVASATGTTITLEAGNTTSGLTYTSGGNWYLIPTARTTGLTLQNGLYLQTGQLNYLYIGTIMAGEQGVSGETNDSTSSRLVYNYFNRVPRYLLANDLNTYTNASSTPAYRDATLNLGIGRFECVLGLVDTTYYPYGVNFQASNSVGIELLQGQSWNTVASISGPDAIGISQVNSNFISVFNSGYTNQPALGYNFMQAMEESISGTTSFESVSTWALLNQ